MKYGNGTGQPSLSQAPLMIRAPKATPMLLGHICFSTDTRIQETSLTPWASVQRERFSFSASWQEAAIPATTRLFSEVITQALNQDL